MKHIFVHNPAAGKTCKGEFARLCEALQAYDGKITYEIYETKSPGDATVFVRERAGAEPEEQLPLLSPECG